MRKQKTIETPDKVFKLPYGDEIEVFVRDNHVLFCIHCDGTGTSIKVSKREIKRWISKRR